MSTREPRRAAPPGRGELGRRGSLAARLSSPSLLCSSSGSPDGIYSSWNCLQKGFQRHQLSSELGKGEILGGMVVSEPGYGRGERCPSHPPSLSLPFPSGKAPAGASPCNASLLCCPFSPCWQDDPAWQCPGAAPQFPSVRSTGSGAAAPGGHRWHLGTLFLQPQPPSKPCQSLGRHWHSTIP